MVTEEELKELFTPFGEIEKVDLIMNKFSGRSKGLGFVTYKNKADADKAIAEMNVKDCQGRPLKVAQAKPVDPDRPRRPRRDFGGRDRDRGRGRGRRF